MNKMKSGIYFLLVGFCCLGAAGCQSSPKTPAAQAVKHEDVALPADDLCSMRMHDIEGRDAAVLFLSIGICRPSLMS